MDIEIPYNVEERKDTGLYNSKLGFWLFLAILTKYGEIAKNSQNPRFSTQQYFFSRGRMKTPTI